MEGLVVNEIDTVVLVGSRTFLSPRVKKRTQRTQKTGRQGDLKKTRNKDRVTRRGVLGAALQPGFAKRGTCRKEGKKSVVES